MSYKAGEIYFVRETVADDGLSPFVKIGLVAFPRTSEERLLEHQTGNPRRLVIPEGHVVTTEAVSRVEAQLHRRFATNRIGGEWFNFDDSGLLETAISHARQLATEIGSATPAFLEAERLNSIESNGLTVESFPEAVQVAMELAASKEMEKLCAKVSNAITSKLDTAKEQGEEVPTRVVTFRPKFDQTSFVEENPNLAAKYLSETAVWIPRFLLKFKMTSEYELDFEFLNELSAISSLVESVSDSSQFLMLEEPTLRLTRLEALVDWEMDLATAKLKILCGENEAIAGICSWKRESKNKEFFDLKNFMVENSDVYLDYLTDEKTRIYTVRNSESRRK